MKAMKYLSMVLLMLVTSVCMFSCSDDDEPTADSLVGTRWSYTEFYKKSNNVLIQPMQKSSLFTLR